MEGPSATEPLQAEAEAAAAYTHAQAAQWLAARGWAVSTRTLQRRRDRGGGATEPRWSERELRVLLRQQGCVTTGTRARRLFATEAPYEVVGKVARVFGVTATRVLQQLRDLCHTGKDGDAVPAELAFEYAREVQTLSGEALARALGGTRLRGGAKAVVSQQAVCCLAWARGREHDRDVLPPSANRRIKRKIQQQQQQHSEPSWRAHVPEYYRLGGVVQPLDAATDAVAQRCHKQARAIATQLMTTSGSGSAGIDPNGDAVLRKDCPVWLQQHVQPVPQRRRRVALQQC